MRVLVCGGRFFEDRGLLFSVLDRLHDEHAFTVVIHGMAPGADRLADHWAIFNRIPAYRFHANWTKHRHAAGPIRNQRMLDRGKPELAVGFPGGNGTKDMLRKALGADVPVLKVGADGAIRQWVKRVDVEEAINERETGQGCFAFR
jgi:hypothetical protein